MSEEAKDVNSQGAGPADLDPGQTGGGNAKPAEQKQTPQSKTDDETHGEPVKKGPADKAKEADKGKDDDKGEGNPDGGTPEDLNDVDEGWKENYVELPDEAGNAVIELLRESGVKPVEANAIFEKALQSGKLEDINWEVLRSRLGEAKFTLAKAGIQSHYDNVFKKNTETKAAVYEQVGGEENWNKVVKWAKAQEAKDPKFKSELDDIRDAINYGGRAAKAAVEDLKALYEKAPGNNGLGVNKVTQGTQAAQVEGGPIGRADYVTAMKIAQEKGDKAAIANLRARREAGMRAGI